MKHLVAVYGGSFNPFGNNHLDVVRYVAESGEFSHIILVPSIAHALKSELTPYEHRYNMTKVGIESRHHAVPSFPEHVGISVSLAELHMLRQQSGPVYTYQLLQYLKATYDPASPDTEYRFVIGPDIWDEIGRWKYVDKIQTEFGFFEAPDVGLHMSQVRDMISNGVSTWNKHVPHTVEAYVNMHNLYNVNKLEAGG